MVASKASSRIGAMSIYVQWTVTGMLSMFALGYWESRGALALQEARANSADLLRWLASSWATLDFAEVLCT